MLNKIYEEIELGIKINDKRIDIPIWANGTAIITDKEKELENILGIRNQQWKMNII